MDTNIQLVFSSSIYYAYTEYEFNKISGRKQLLDFERILSNFIRFLKKSIRLFSKKLYLKIKNYFIKKFNLILTL